MEKRSFCGAWVSRVGLGLSAVLLLCGVTACSATNSLLGGNTRKDAVAEIAWDYAQNAVMLEIEAHPKLNQYEGEAHTLVLGVYQMEDSAAFYKLMADSSMIGKTLETGNAGDGFVYFTRYVVTPGQRSILELDRAQKAKFVGIAAGYYQMEGGKSTRLFQVPLTVESEGMVSKTYKAAPALLAVRLNFGPDEVLNAQRLNHDPTQKKLSEVVPLDGGGRELKLDAGSVKNALDTASSLKKLDK